MFEVVKICIQTRLSQRTCLTLCLRRSKQWEISAQTRPHTSKVVQENVLSRTRSSVRWRCCGRRRETTMLYIYAMNRHW